MSLEIQKTRLTEKIARLPEGEARDRAKLHLAEVEAALRGGRAEPTPPLPKPPKDG